MGIPLSDDGLRRLFRQSSDVSCFPVVMLDGGMGTTLQSPPFNLPLDSALWSSELLDSQDGLKTLRALHQAWVEAGAEVLGSCSYQSSLPLFKTEVPDERKALQNMTAALPVFEADFEPSSSFQQRSKPKVALSLGPFGAQHQPGQEYAGQYCAPFGRHGSPSKLAYPNTEAELYELPLRDVGTTTDSCEDHLAAWHLARLRHFATSKHWRQVSLIAFETIPNAYEARAIRRAVAAFAKNCAPTDDCPPFYISFVFPLDNKEEAHYPDLDLKDKVLAEAVDALVDSCYQAQGATPFGIGINCTNPLKTKPVLEAFIESIRARQIARPCLIFYPDGGSVYDTKTRTWSNPDGINESDWARIVADQVAMAKDARTFSGVMVGGCCKAGPSAIKALRLELEHRQLM